MTTERIEPSELWIVGYGNTQRRDDGIGPYVVGRLHEILGDGKNIHFRTVYQLDPCLAEELQHAAELVLVDATLSRLEDGWEWAEIQPESGSIPYTTHHFKPSFLLRILDSLYHRSPRTWVASVQGEDFGFGEGVSPEAGRRAEKAISEIAKRFATKEIDKKDESVRLYEKGV